MTTVHDITPAASVDDALRDAFRRIEAQPVPKALEALVEALAGPDGVEDPVS